MARSRRKYRRSTAHSAASLLALGLPAPLQRVAGSQLGPLLMFFGVPAMLVVGLLQVDWQNGTPQLTVNTQKASEFRDVVKGQLGNLDNQAAFQYWQQTATDAWSATQSSPPQSYQQPYAQSQANYPPQSVPGAVWPEGVALGQNSSNQSGGYAGTNVSGVPARSGQAPFPSTNPPGSSLGSGGQSLVRGSSGQLTASSALQGQSPLPAYSQLAAADREQLLAEQQRLVQQQQYQYQQQLYQQQLYEQRLYQQQLYEQQLYQQQLYQQQQPQQARPQATQAPPQWQNR